MRLDALASGHGWNVHRAWVDLRRGMPYGRQVSSLFLFVAQSNANLRLYNAVHLSSILAHVKVLFLFHGTLRTRKPPV